MQPSVGNFDEDRLLVFTEPNLAFSLASRSGHSVTVRVHLSRESGPSAGNELFDFFVLIEMTPPALVEAIDAWAETVRAFPAR